MSVKKRVKDFISKINIPIATFEKSINASNGYVNSITKSIGIDKLERIIEVYPNLDPEWLLTGEGMMLRSSKAELTIADIALPKHKTENSIPLIPTEAVSTFLNDPKDYNGIIIKESYVIPDFYEQGATYLIRVNGVDMQPKFSPGDLLACKPIANPSFFQWGKVYVLSTQQGSLIKYLHQDDHNENVLWCRSENEKNYPAFAINKKDIQQVAIAIGIVRME